ncbi:RNA polymerase sigma-E factor precursor [compost metagenome]
MDTSIDDLIAANIRLVYFIARKFDGMTNKYGVHPDDVFSSGLQGLWQACVKFDESKGQKFSTFASTCIRNEIIVFFRNATAPIRYREDTWSFDYYLSESGLTLKDTLAAPEEEEPPYDVQQLQKIWDGFWQDRTDEMWSHRKEVVILHLRGMKGTDIAKKYGISRSAVSRLTSKTLYALKRYASTIEEG